MLLAVIAVMRQEIKEFQKRSKRKSLGLLAVYDSRQCCFLRYTKTMLGC